MISFIRLGLFFIEFRNKCLKNYVKSKYKTRVTPYLPPRSMPPLSLSKELHCSQVSKSVSLSYYES